MLRTLFILTAAAACARCRSGRCRRLQVQGRPRQRAVHRQAGTLPAERLNIQSQKTDTVAVQTRAAGRAEAAAGRRQGEPAGRQPEPAISSRPRRLTADSESRAVREGAPALRQLHEFAAALRAASGRPAPLPQRCRARRRPRVRQSVDGCDVQVTLRVGFVGLGAMGLGMARNLHKQQLLSAVWNRTPAKAQALAQETGCTAVAKAADARPAQRRHRHVRLRGRGRARSRRRDRAGAPPGHHRHRLLHRQRRHGAHRCARAARARRSVSRRAGQRRSRRRARRHARHHGRRRRAGFRARACRCCRRWAARSRTSARAAPARRRRRRTRSCAPASSRPSRKRWRSRSPRTCRSTA